MKTLWQTLFQKLRSVLRERLDLALQIMALRHQLAILERSAKRPHFSCADRCFWILLSTVWTRWQEALEIVQADTVHRWRRQGVWHSLRGWRERTRPGRPTLAAETRALIRRMSQEKALSN